MVSVNAGVNPMVDTIGGFAVAGVIFYAGWRSLTYNETPGEFFSFITALLMAYEPARRLARLQVRLEPGLHRRRHDVRADRFPADPDRTRRMPAR